MAKFPTDFIWGTASSAFQIEGALSADGRGKSIWDVFCRRPGAIEDGSWPDPACDHYRRYKDDVRLMRELGLKAYRFSVAWPRIFPTGAGAVNRAGLDFYSRLVDELLENGITPFATLYHWDMPQPLEEKGGWRRRDTAQYFADYGFAVVKALGSRVPQWITFNELPVIVELGHRDGLHAPGAREPAPVQRQIAHHLLLAHGWTAERIKDTSQKLSVGLAHNIVVKIPEGHKPDNLPAAQRAFQAANDPWLLPIFSGQYPQEHLKDMPAGTIRTRDMGDIRAPLDFLGLNIYHGNDVARDDASPQGFRDIPWDPAAPQTTMGWPIRPDAIYYGLLMAKDVYQPHRLFVTENGAAFDEPAPRGGRIHDVRRIAFLEAHVAELKRALAAGVPVGGYFVWTLLDNFEWSHGFTKKFGLVHVDFKTQKRTLKDSALWYQRLIAEGV